MTNFAVVAKNIGKQYRRYHIDRPYTFQEALFSGWRHVRTDERFWALKDVNLSLMPGEMLGVIGKNGAGKSTLLKVLSGVLYPDKGSLSLSGRVSCLLSLGGCFHPSLTGRENIFANGVIAGLTRSEVKERLDEIIDFSGLSQYVDSPVRIYSSGMIMRLGFSIAICTDPSVLLVDECLSVGDLAFSAKCEERIHDMRAKGCAVVLVTHSMDTVMKQCDRALWMHQGRVAAYGDNREVVEQYEKFMATTDSVIEPAPLAATDATTDGVHQPAQKEPALVK